MFDELARSIHEDRLEQARRRQRVQEAGPRALRWYRRPSRPSGAPRLSDATDR